MGEHCQTVAGRVLAEEASVEHAVVIENLSEVRAQSGDASAEDSQRVVNRFAMLLIDDQVCGRARVVVRWNVTWVQIGIIAVWNHVTVSNVRTRVCQVTDIRSIVESKVVVSVAVVIAAQSMCQ
jgi:hypothetical protein